MDDLFGDEDESGEETSSSIERDPACGALAFHDGTEEALFVYLRQHAEEGNIDSILAATDQFCYQRHWMMHIGDQKRKIIEKTFLEAKEKKYASSSATLSSSSSPSSKYISVELGSYCGYSALVFAQYLDPSKDEHLYCVEAHPKCVAYTKRMISLAKVEHLVTVIHAAAGDVSQWTPALPEESLIDFLFIDHDKNSYYSDLQAIVNARLLSSGAYVVADNVLCFNCPLNDYLQFVRNTDLSSPFQSSTIHEGFLEYTTEAERQATDGAALVDGIEVSIAR